MRSPQLLKKIHDEYHHQIQKRRYEWITRYNRKNNKQLTVTDSKVILVIRLDAIGDSIIWLDQAKEYRDAFPNHKIVLFHDSRWKEIAKNLPFFDECIEFDRNRKDILRYYRQILHKLNQYTYEKIFSPVFHRDPMLEDFFIRNTNAIEKIGYKKNSIDTIGDKYYTRLISSDGSIMELQRNAHFVRQTINPDFISHLPIIPFPLPDTKILTGIEQYAVFFVGAGNPLRSWPIEKFRQIIDYINCSTIVFCGSNSDKSVFEGSCFNSSSKKIVTLFGQTTLIELISVIAKAELVISNDTSAAHIAIATRTPSIVLLGGGDEGQFHPYQADSISELEKSILPRLVSSPDHSCFNCGWNCKYPLKNGRWKCIADIQVSDVIKAIQNIDCKKHMGSESLGVNPCSATRSILQTLP